MRDELSISYISQRHTSQLTMMGGRCWSLWLLLLVLGQILLFINQADSSPANQTIHIGYLASFLQDGGAINVAIEQAQNDGLLSKYNFR